MELGAEVNIRCRSPQVGAEVIPCRSYSCRISIAPSFLVRVQLRFVGLKQFWKVNYLIDSDKSARIGLMLCWRIWTSLLEWNTYRICSKITSKHDQVLALNSWVSLKFYKKYEHGQVIMLIINFEIFVLIVQKISAKLLPGANKSNTSPSVQDFYSTNTTSKQKPRTNPTLRLAKATLTLIPVMGMQNLIFILIPSQGEYNKTDFCQDLKKVSSMSVSG